MLRDGLPRGIEVLGYLPSRQFVIMHEPENGQAALLSQGLKQIFKTVRRASINAIHCRHRYAVVETHMQSSVSHVLRKGQLRTRLLAC